MERWVERCCYHQLEQIEGWLWGPNGFLHSAAEGMHICPFPELRHHHALLILQQRSSCVP